MIEGGRAGARAVERIIRQFGCLPDAMDGPKLPAFDAAALAEAIRSEVMRSGEFGWSKITIHLDIPDAVMLMNFLKSRA
jgi:hypothetical protein